MRESKLKLNWFSPLPPARTDIAHYTARVLPALATLADVTLWTDQSEWDHGVEQYAEVRRFRLSRMPWVDLNRANASFYHIGNNPHFHGPIWQISRLHPGVVVLHDFRLHHFFDGLYRAQWHDLNSYLAVMSNYYGDEGRRDAADCYRNDARNIQYMAERYPLTELAIENALGVIVHTQETFAALAENSRAPITYAPLPFAASGPAEQHQTRQSAGPPYRLIVVGYIGRNRRLEAVCNALAALPEKDQFHLDVYGNILDGETQLRALLRSLDLKKHVTLHGFAAEAELDEALSRAQLAINLRYPTMGEASGSQLRIWSHSLPSLVSRVGWYGSLPADAVAFVRTDDNEVADIQAHLQAFLAQPAAFALMGERGRNELDQKHTPNEYAKTIVATAAKAEEFRARAVSFKLAERAGMLLSEWLGPNAIEAACDSVAQEIVDLAGGASAAHREGAERV
jgi:glycosyltransferase involved in cell wall biosynthesis